MAKQDLCLRQLSRTLVHSNSHWKLEISFLNGNDQDGACQRKRWLHCYGPDRAITTVSINFKIILPALRKIDIIWWRIKHKVTSKDTILLEITWDRRGSPVILWSSNKNIDQRLGIQLDWYLWKTDNKILYPTKIFYRVK